jgi:hypothetical protein
MSNPFFYSNPVSSDQFIDRKRELRRITGRIINQGQSTAIVGEPRSGKTSLLLYLAVPEKRQELYGEEGEHLLFSFLDAQTFGTKFSQSQFWEQALRPLDEIISADPKPASKEDVPQEKTPPEVLARLRRNLDEYFNDEELRNLCADLNVDYDNLPAQGKENKIRELIAYLDRRLRIPELAKKCGELRPKASWGIPSQVQLAPLALAYKVCQDNNFGTFVLERLFGQMNLEGRQLVLLLDEFDSLLHHPTLNKAEFFGSLRSLASRSRGALALVIASRYSLTNLNENTFQFSRGSSPYFNFLDEITLGPWPENAVDELMQLASDLFAAADRRFIAELAGVHPYLLQAAAFELWDAYDETEDDADKRRLLAGRNLYHKAEMVLGDTWRLWSPATRKAFTAVALDYLPNLLPEREVYVSRLTRDLRDLEPELRSLEKQGYVTEDTSIPSGWRVRAGVFLWWLADELVKIVRRDTPFEEWLQAQEMEGLLTKGEKQRLEKAARGVGEVLKGGATALIQAAAKGFGEAIAKTK